MNASLCELLDGFLGQWLTEPERTAFQAHLTDCAGCRHQLEENERLNCWLQEAMAQVAPTPAGLIPQLERQLKRARRRRLTVGLAGGVAAALVLGGLSAWWLQQPKPDEKTPQTPIVEAPAPARAEPSVARPVRVTFARPREVIAVPRQTDNPAVTIIWVYPAVQTVPSGSSQPQDRRSP